MIYPRLIYAQLEKELETLEATVITGMRRVGKSTALEHLFALVKSDNKVMFDLEDPIKRQLFDIEDYETVWQRLAPWGIDRKERAYIFLDEIQNLPQITSLVKYLIDHHQTKFFLTGSSSYYLKNLFPQSLSGRKLVFEMFPLTFCEYLVFRRKELSISFPDKPENWAGLARKKLEVIHSKMLPLYEEYLRFGGYPKVVLEPDYERKLLHLQEVFKAYFEIDVKNLADFRNIELLRKFILLLVPRIGSKLDVSKLASEVGVSRETVNNYLAFLESTYLITRLPRYSKSVDRMMSLSPKVFFCDVGLAQVLGPLSAGQIAEQGVFQNLRTNHELSYFMTTKGGEIDFVVDGQTGLEVKKHAARRDVANLKKRLASAKLPEGYVVTQDYGGDPEIILATDL